LEALALYQRHAKAQVYGANLSVVLDVEPEDPDEEETPGALRPLARMHELSWLRFFVTVRRRRLT
jgi:hypothetical protein